MLLKAALSYARRSIPVFPCEPGVKRPLTYNGFWDAHGRAPYQGLVGTLAHGERRGSYGTKQRSSSVGRRC